MWIIVGLVISVAVIELSMWLSRRYVIDTLRFFGVGGVMSGMYAYRKFGLWHIGHRYIER